MKRHSGDGFGARGNLGGGGVGGKARRAEITTKKPKITLRVYKAWPSCDCFIFLGFMKREIAGYA